MKKTTVRVISILLVALLTLGLISSVLVTIASAAVATSGTTSDTARIITGDTTVSRTMTVGKVSTGLTVKFYFLDPINNGIDLSSKSSYTPDEFTIGSSFGWSRNTTLTIDYKSKGSGNNQVWYYEAILKNVSYNGSGTGSLLLTLINEDFTMDVPIPSKYFNTSGESDGELTSRIVWHSTVVRNAAGQKLETLEKKTGPVTVEVFFYDIGLKDESNSSIDAAKKYAFITSPTGFNLHDGSFGTVERVSSTTEFPRFKATFTRVERTGSANTLTFSVLYDFEEYGGSKGGDVTATLFQIKTEDEDDGESATLKPNIIIQEYSYGKESIVAGEEFNLNLNFRNTSTSLGVENVVMTIEPGGGFAITAASNTAYFPGLAPNETKDFSIALRANPTIDSTTADYYNITITFSYQYLSKSSYVDVPSSSVKIAIPVIQLDRFGVDEITDYSQYLGMGEEGYVTVPITNKGKSRVYNITSTVKNTTGADFSAAPAHFSGPLEAGKNGTIDISIMINTPGVFEAEAVVTYEDENMNQKELSVPFSIMVYEPSPPQMEMPPMNPDEAAAPQGMGLASILFCVAGALLMAVPVALYIIKRVKAKGSEDVDEDF